MNTVVTPLDPFPAGNQQNPFTFCDDGDYDSDRILYRHSDYHFENASSNDKPAVSPSSFHVRGEARPAQRKCAPVLNVTSEEKTNAMAPRGAIKLKICSSTESKIDGISNTISTTSTSEDGTSDESDCEKDEKKSKFLTTQEVPASAQETDAKPDVHIESNLGETNYDNGDDVSADNDKECKEEIKEASISDVMLSRAVTKKRGNRRDRSQTSAKKRWKHLNAEDMGFHLSSFPRLPAVSGVSKFDPTDECRTLEASTEAPSTESVLVETLTKRSDEDLTKADSSSEPIRSSGVSCEKEKGDHEVADDEGLDDEAFFASLGIDVRDSGETFHTDDILQWDGVRFDNPSVLHSSSSKDNRSTDTTRRKSDMYMKPLGSHDKRSETDSRVMINKYVCNMSKHDVGILFDSGCTSSTKTYLRPDRHRRQVKCHKAVKSKHAKMSEVFHNPSKKQLYMHHRLIKLLDINVDFLRGSAPRRGQPTAMPKTKVAQDWIKGIRIKTYKAGQSGVGQSRTIPATSPQNLNHVLAEANVPGEFEMDLVSFLLSVQNRELTPEDYEMLLRLDNSVKTKTVSKNVLDSLKTETIGEGVVIDTMCTICMEPYAAGQVRKFLPCQHDFHNECIDTWLNNSSQNCPLDGLPVDDS